MNFPNHPWPEADEFGALTNARRFNVGIKHKPPFGCLRCEPQWITVDEDRSMMPWSYELTVSPGKATAIMTRYMKQLKVDRSHLMHICDKFGNTILSRWKKKSREKREALLLEAVPSMDTEPFYRLRKDGMDTSLSEVRPKFRIRLQSPSVHVRQQIVIPDVLISLLHNRICYSPEDWAPFDSDILRQGWANNGLAIQCCSDREDDSENYCVVMHGHAYGELVKWDKDAAERWDIVGYPRGRLIVEAQALMFSWLRSIVDLILEGVNLQNTGASDKWQEMIQAGFKQTNNVELWSEYINQPFSRPPKFDVDYHCSLARARLQEAEDNIWLLQTDPSYVRRFIKIMATGEVYTSERKHTLITEDISEAVNTLVRWQEVSQEWDHIRDHYRRFRDSIHPGSQLPRPIQRSLANLEVAIVGNMDRKARYLTAYITQRPGFQHKWRFHTTGPRSIKPERTCNTETTKLYYEDPLEWTVMHLLVEPDRNDRFDHTELFAKLEAHLAQTSLEDRSRLDETIYSKLSDFAALHEMLVAVRNHRPCFIPRGEQDSKTLSQKESTLFTRSSVRDNVPPRLYCFPAGIFKEFDQTQAASGRMSLDWLTRRKTERDILERFWAEARKVVKSKLSDTHYTKDDIDTVLASLSASSTAEYKALVEEESAQVFKAIERAATIRKVASAPVSHETKWDTAPEESKLTIRKRSSKQKTRPVEQVVSTAEPDPVPHVEPSEDVPIPQIPATKRALDVFKKMYPTNAEEASAKPLDWDLFVHAMNDVGFTACGNGGSAVSFESPDRRRIIFHRPHPTPKIDPIILYAMGKRLRKHFGWHRGVFLAT